MAERSKIEWCDHTFNPWRGCSKVPGHPGCAFCYAEATSKRNTKVLGIWGQNGRRVLASEQAWNDPLRWNKWAREGACRDCHGRGNTKHTVKGFGYEACQRCNGHGKEPGGPYRSRVFCASLADVFEDWDRPMYEHRGNPTLTHMDDVRARLFCLIDATPQLDWLILTKRPENIRRMWPAAGTGKDPGAEDYLRRENVWLGTSVSDQATADRFIPDLLKCRGLAPVLFLSAEPLISPLSVEEFLRLGNSKCNRCGCHGDDPPGTLTHCKGAGCGTITTRATDPSIDWVIVGGESGPKARQCDLEWIGSIRDECKAADVPCFIKQLGRNAVCWDDGGMTGNGRSCDYYTDDSKGGDWDEWPSDLRIREFPKP